VSYATPTGDCCAGETPTGASCAWSVVARFDWDSHYPHPIWGAKQRDVPGGAASRLGSRCPNSMPVSSTL
jgi:hypothetical protein